MGLCSKEALDSSRGSPSPLLVGNRSVVLLPLLSLLLLQLERESHRKFSKCPHIYISSIESFCFVSESFSQILCCRLRLCEALQPAKSLLGWGPPPCAPLGPLRHRQLCWPISFAHNSRLLSCRSTNHHESPTPVFAKGPGVVPLVHRKTHSPKAATRLAPNSSP